MLGPPNAFASCTRASGIPRLRGRRPTLDGYVELAPVATACLALRVGGATLYRTRRPPDRTAPSTPSEAAPSHRRFGGCAHNACESSTAHASTSFPAEAPERVPQAERNRQSCD